MKPKVQNGHSTGSQGTPAGVPNATEELLKTEQFRRVKCHHLYFLPVIPVTNAKLAKVLDMKSEDDFIALREYAERIYRTTDYNGPFITNLDGTYMCDFPMRVLYGDIIVNNLSEVFQVIKGSRTE